MRFPKVGPHGELTLTKDLTTTPAPHAVLSQTRGADNDEITFHDLDIGSGTRAATQSFCFAPIQPGRTAWTTSEWTHAASTKPAVSSSPKPSTPCSAGIKMRPKCYVYLSDVSTCHEDEQPTQKTWETAFRHSRWFTPGWTLQELLAPRLVEFFSREGRPLGSKQSLEGIIHEITDIPVATIRGCPLSTFSVDERLRWPISRDTKRVEDKAYCLLGIFGVFLPLIYGEDAYKRLRQGSRRALADSALSFDPTR
ncbi:hypothetical protein GJ744_004012 [Endocarpon pusillum]|uniref:Heterokaryon incompatibility domain-containing protein n=1 Tax=Endocarpon pusillum TaxID=364733 RepID=A0A8H7DZE7_9EURO|nr:hypothetical protein GJ744_004012 [Endocarpon pusillum]